MTITVGLFIPASTVERYGSYEANHLGCAVRFTHGKAPKVVAALQQHSDEKRGDFTVPVPSAGFVQPDEARGGWWIVPGTQGVQFKREWAAEIAEAKAKADAAKKEGA